jgi:hypothetical protein
MTLQIKRSAWIIVACGALALGALGAAMTEQRDLGTVMSHDPTTSASVSTPPMATGNTGAISTPPTAPETSVATPEITTTPTSAKAGDHNKQKQQEGGFMPGS